VKPAARRQAVVMAQEEHGLSRRRACRLIGISRCSVAERAPRRERDYARLRERLRALAGERRRFGYRRLHELLRREGFATNHKLVHRLYQEEKLAIRRRGRQKRRSGIMARAWCPIAANQRWSLDFIEDCLANGRPQVPHRQPQGRLHA
jgi:putative transposase